MSYNEDDPSGEKKISNTILFYLSDIAVSLFFLSPIVSFIKFRKKIIYKINYLPGIQVFSIFFNCLFWIFRGLGLKGDNVYFKETIIFNIIGLVISIAWILLYWIYLEKFKDNFIFIFTICNVIFQISIAVLFVGGSFSKKNDYGQSITYVVADFYNVVMYGSLFQNIYFSWKDKENKIIPIFEVGFGLLSCIMWLFYGIISNQFSNVILPNCIGFGICLFQMALCLVLYSTIKTPKIESIKPDNLLPKKE